ncbi:MAG TPA: GntR family transcriptional regulator, partial [Plasticicumulans sp.]|nr:GntR family transcriptional regulator [Plasticicumulans sp.]
MRPAVVARQTPAERQRRLRIVEFVGEQPLVQRREGRVAGDHLPEVQLSERIGTSRSPVQVALRYLVGEGVLAHARPDARIT